MSWGLSPWKNLPEMSNSVFCEIKKKLIISFLSAHLFLRERFRLTPRALITIAADDIVFLFVFFKGNEI